MVVVTALMLLLMSYVGYNTLFSGIVDMLGIPLGGIAIGTISLLVFAISFIRVAAEANRERW